MTGDLRVEGDTHVRNLRMDEYLEVPELKYNRITATGNEFWVTDGGTVDDVAESDDGIYLVTLKSDEDETAISFQFKEYPAQHLLYGERRRQSGRCPHGLFRGNGRYRPNTSIAFL